MTGASENKSGGAENKKRASSSNANRKGRGAQSAPGTNARVIAKSTRSKISRKSVKLDLRSKPKPGDEQKDARAANKDAKSSRNRNDRRKRPSPSKNGNRGGRNRDSKVESAEKATAVQGMSVDFAENTIMALLLQIESDPAENRANSKSSDSADVSDGSADAAPTTEAEPEGELSLADMVKAARAAVQTRIAERIKTKKEKNSVFYVVAGWLLRTMGGKDAFKNDGLCMTLNQLRDRLQTAGFGMPQKQLTEMMPKWAEAGVIRVVSNEEQAAEFIEEQEEEEAAKRGTEGEGEGEAEIGEEGEPAEEEDGGPKPGVVKRTKKKKKQSAEDLLSTSVEADCTDVLTPLVRAISRANRGGVQKKPKPAGPAPHILSRGADQFQVDEESFLAQVRVSPEQLFASVAMALDVQAVADADTSSESSSKGVVREAALMLLAATVAANPPAAASAASAAEEWAALQPLLLPHALALLLPALRCLAPGSKAQLRGRVGRAAAAAVDAILGAVERSPLAVGVCVQSLVSALDTTERWQSVEAACLGIERLSAKHPHAMTRWLAELVPVLTTWLADTKQEVRGAADRAVRRIAEDSMDNDDVRPLLPALLSSMTNPDEFVECLHALSSTTFVQTVTCAPLALITPLLVRGLAMQARTATKRMSAVIVTNMSKLVEDPGEAVPFLPKLMPLLGAAGKELADEEARGVCAKAHAQLSTIEAEAEALVKKSGGLRLSAGWASRDGVLKVLREAVAEEQGAADLKGVGEGEDAIYMRWPGASSSRVSATQCLQLCSWMSCSLLDDRSMPGTVHTYARELGAFLRPALVVGTDEGEQSLLRVCKKVLACGRDGPEEEEADDSAELLCDTKFTLAFGSKILLHNTRLTLRRGIKYGLLGCNDCGKTSLLRAIANEQVEGFPDATEVKTSFVEADIAPDLSDLTCVQYVMADERVKAMGVSEEKVRESLNAVGFVLKKDGRYAAQDDEVNSLSGGWRMKLALARVMLHEADVLLMDEPTNHLDVINVQWLLDYLRKLTNVTAVLVSTHKQLLTQVTTQIMHIDRMKLNVVKGNLDAFVAAVPSAKAYFDFAATSMKFKFPQPSFIEGIKSKGKALMKMKDVEFTYPGNDSTTLRRITVQVSLASRVACVGRNGAGKSTMVKLLTGELEASKGECWQHPGCRCAYVAQHAFHHIENHLDKTANEYIRWRYQYGEDREAVVKKTMLLTDDEAADCEREWKYEIVSKDGSVTVSKRNFKRMTGLRRKDKKSGQFEYEVIWQQHQIAPTWERAFKMSEHSKGFEKLIKVIDTKEAAKAGLYQRPLTQKNVEDHLEDIGLAAEFGTHNRMSALSGGQKVKVVIAAAMWNQPHIVILDEPTNYLDRESLGALAHAIEAFDGGVVIISHNDDFCSKLCKETWVLEMGNLDCKGDAEWMRKAEAAAVEVQEVDEMVDAAGNKIKLETSKSHKPLDRKERKMLEKELKELQEAGEDTYEIECRLGYFDEK